MASTKKDPAVESAKAETTVAAESVKAVEPVEPVKPTEPVEPAEPAPSAEPAPPTKPAEPTPPAKPAKPAAKPAAKTKAKAKASSKAKSHAENQQIVFDPSADRTAVARQALDNPAILMTLIENLSIETRRIRQFSAAAIGVVSESDPEVLVVHIPHIVDALHRPEAQTRWESLEVLTRIVSYNPDACDNALLGAEGSLYDEESGIVRLAAVRFLCAYGALDAGRSARVWPLLDEAIQCYHGDPEFQDMLISVISFASGDISKEVRSSLASRMGFDAANARGALKRRATQIIELCKKKK
jgi:chemotaxis protein histidine kinase CheA